MTKAVSVTTQVYRVYIKATPQAIWDAITKPEWTEKYGYGGRSVYDLRPGGTYRGYTSDAMKKAEGKDIPLVSQAKVVPAGVVRLMELQEKGWSYVRP